MSQRNAANPAEIDRAELVGERQAADLRWVMSEPSGRRFIWELMGDTGLYRPSFNHSGSITAFNEGARNVGLALLDKIMAICPDAYLEAQQEHLALQKREADRLNNDTTE